eukprot:768156-Hanusia_phi.AAC.1
MCVRALQAMKENSFLISGDLTLSNACSAPFLPHRGSLVEEEEARLPVAGAGLRDAEVVVEAVVVSQVGRDGLLPSKTPHVRLRGYVDVVELPQQEEALGHALPLPVSPGASSSLPTCRPGIVSQWLLDAPTICRDPHVIGLQGEVAREERPGSTAGPA